MKKIFPATLIAATLAAGPLPEDFLAHWQANHAAFPLGVDCIVAAGADAAALPRSVRLTGAG